MEKQRPTTAPGCKRKAHGQSRSCARKNTSCFGFGNGKAQEQRIAYLTYPGTFASAGITVTFSRGISPHSAAGKTGTPSCYSIHKFNIAHRARKCKREFSQLLVAVFRHPGPDVVHKAAGGGGQGLFILDTDADITVEGHGRGTGGDGVGAMAHHQFRQ